MSSTVEYGIRFARIALAIAVITTALAGGAVADTDDVSGVEDPDDPDEKKCGEDGGLLAELFGGLFCTDGPILDFGWV